jgi:dihydrofolate reductase
MTMPMSALEPIICFTLARAENGVIGKDGGLAWRLPDDFKHFKELTRGKPIIMGRTTLTSDLKKPLSDRTNIVLTRDPDFRCAGALVAHSIDEALALARREASRLGAGEIHVIGGAEVFRAALPYAQRIYLTEVHAAPAGDAHLEAFDPKVWREVSRLRHEADARHIHAFSFVTLERA